MPETLSRRDALARLGLAVPVAYAAPALVILVAPDDAHAQALRPSRPDRPPRPKR